MPHSPSELDGQSSLKAEQVVLPPAPVQENGVERRQCKAHLRDGSGERCPNYPMTGREVCYQHGGAMVQSELKTAKHSQYLPKRLQERFEEFWSRPDWISLREQINICDARLAEINESASGDLSVESAREIRKLVKEALNDLAFLDDPEQYGENDGAAMRQILLKIDRFCDEKLNYEAIQEKANRQHELLRKLKETEVKRMVAANQVLTVTESYTLIQRLASFVEEYIEDLQVRATAVRELYKLLNRKGSA